VGAYRYIAIYIRLIGLTKPLRFLPGLREVNMALDADGKEARHRKDTWRKAKVYKVGVSACPSNACCHLFDLTCYKVRLLSQAKGHEYAEW
jgi:hypothetical protein